VEAVRKDPARVTAEVRNFLAQYSERAKQRALEAAAKAQQGATIGSWVTFGVMIATLAVSLVGAMGGVLMVTIWPAGGPCRSANRRAVFLGETLHLEYNCSREGSRSRPTLPTPVVQRRISR
jgi:hypothetical protein